MPILYKTPLILLLTPHKIPPKFEASLYEVQYMMADLKKMKSWFWSYNFRDGRRHPPQVPWWTCCFNVGNQCNSYFTMYSAQNAKQINEAELSPLNISKKSHVNILDASFGCQWLHTKCKEFQKFQNCWFTSKITPFFKVACHRHRS